MDDLTCVVVEAGKPCGKRVKLKSRRWCTMHYARWQKYGDPLTLTRPVLGPDVLCTMGGCGKPVVGLGLCQKHYQRKWKHGNPEIVLVARGAPPAARFWSKVDKNGPASAYAPHLGQCWIWTGAQKDGYGMFGVRRRLVQAHRFAYEQLREPIPEGLELDHLCRVHSCVNPLHLEPVTKKVNAQRGAEARLAERGGKCVNGHDLTPGNLYVSKNGRQACRECTLEAQRRHQARKKGNAALL